MPSRTQRIFRLTTFGILAGLLAYLAIHTILAWTYAFFLTHPTCQESPSPLEKSSLPQKVILETEDGLELAAWYYPSQNGAAVIALGGQGGALGSNPPEVGFLIRGGYGILQIDSRACAKPASPVTLGAKEIFEASSGLAFLQSQTGIDRIGAIGYSMGGVTAIRLAARNDRIAAIVAEGGYFNLGDDLVEPDEPKSLPHDFLLYSIAGFFWLQSGVNPWEVSPIDDLPMISPRPVLLIYGEAEAASGQAEAQFAAAREPKEMWLVVGGSHGANYRIATQEYEARVLRFFDQYLLSH